MKIHLSIPVALFFILLTTSPSNASVSSDQVQSQHIREADGTSGQNTNSGAGIKTGHIQNSAVTSEKIQDGQVQNADLASGAVTDAKISGFISTAKLPVGTTAGTVAAGDHSHDGLYQKKYANVVVVAKSGGDFIEPIAAMNSITNPSQSNPYLLKIMPGVYDLGSGSLLMKRFVDIEGAGENATVITSSVSTGGGTFRTGTLNAVSNSEVRSLTVSNTGTGTHGVAISAGGTSLRLTHVTARASGATEECDGIYSIQSSILMNSVTATASGSNNSYGILVLESSSSIMNNVTTTASGSTVLNVGLGFSQSSPTMNNINAKASGAGGARTIGVYIAYSSPVLNNVTASGSGGLFNSGVVNFLSPSIMHNVVATGSGPYTNSGIEIYDSSATVMNNVTATGRDGSQNSGLAMDGPPMTLLVDRCTFEGSTASIEINAEHDVRIGASKLEGGIINGGGTLTCVASYNGNYAPLDAACQ